MVATLGTLSYAYYSVAINGNFSTVTRIEKYWKLTEREVDENC